LAIAACWAAVGFAFSTSSPSTELVPVDEPELEELLFLSLLLKLQAMTTNTRAKSAKTFFICVHQNSKS
jgi:hypothetical protein